MLPTRAERVPLLSAAAVSAVLAVLGLGLAVFSRAVYDHVIPSHSVPSLAALCAGMAVVLAADAFLKVLRVRWIEAAGESYDARVAEELFGRLMRARMSAMPRAAVAAALFREFEQVRELHSAAVATAVVDAGSAALFLAVIASMSPRLSLVTASGMTVMSAAWALQKAVERRAVGTAPTLSARQALLHEAASGAEDIKLARAEGRMAAEMGKLTEIAAADSASLRFLASLVTVIVQSAAGTVQAAVLAAGSLLVISGSISMGTLIAVSILSGRAMAPCSALAAAALKVGRARAAAVSVRALADAPKEDPSDGVEPAGCRGEVRIEGVRFHYPGREQPALDGFSLTLSPGETVALIGPRGCGKTTFGRLLSGLAELDPARDSGAVLLDGIPVPQFSRRALRGHVGVCPQDAALFSRSLRANIALARPDAADEEILRAAAIACADDWALRLPLGLGTQVFEQGRTMSGGERQSVALARLILADPKVVFLDEPTAHFDPATSRRFVENMRGWLRGRTAVVATHRPEMLAICHRVVLMDRGRAVKVCAPAEALPLFGLQLQPRGRPAPGGERKTP